MWFEKKVVLKLDSDQEQFPIEVLNLWDITELEIIGGSFTYFPEDISILKNLKRLTVVSTKISHFPKEVFLLPKLVYLNLKNNCIEELPKLSQNTKIQTLILGRNKITSSNLLKNLSNFKEVMTFDLSNNLIDTIPNELFSLKKLERLNLDSNKLKTLPSFLKEMRNLSHLSIENNLFTKKEISRIEEELKINLTPTL